MDSIQVKKYKAIKTQKQQEHQDTTPGPDKIKSVQLAEFDLAFCFKKDSCQVQQSFGIEGRVFAPEIMSGLAHGPPVDVWAFGKVAQQLMSYTKTQPKAKSDDPLQ